MGELTFLFQRNSRPIRCHDCGLVCEEYGAAYARRLGWRGFSVLRKERLGQCPSCVAPKEEG